MKNYIITGGAGFIGSHLADKLLPLADKIYIIDNLVRTNSLRNINHLIGNQKIEFVSTDISKLKLEIFYMSEIIDSVFHLAATRINRCVKYPREGHEFIADGGYNVIEFCANKKIKLFFASSASVYASPKRLPIKETDLCQPYTIYGAGKYYTENLLQSFDIMSGLDYTINRFFSVYGVRMDNQGVYTEVIFNWLNSIKNGNRELTVFGDPDEKIIDLVYVSDVVNAIYTTMNSSNKEIYNVSTETGTTLSNLIKVISKVTKTDIKIKMFPETRKDVEKARIGDTTKLKNLGWSPEVSLEEGIEKTWKWIKEGI